MQCVLPTAANYIILKNLIYQVRACESPGPPFTNMV